MAKNAKNFTKWKFSERMENRVRFCENTQSFCANKFIHISEKRINLLELLPPTMSCKEVRQILRPKLGEAYQAIQETGDQLRVVSNMKQGATIKAIPAREFYLPHVVIIKVTSSTFVEHMLSEKVVELSKNDHH